MMRIIGAFMLVPAFFAAGTAVSAPLECPVMSEVLAQVKVGARSINADQLGSKISETVANSGDLHLIANRLKIELPGTQDAEIVNIMVAAYCQNFQSALPADQDLSQLLTDFEQTAYDAVFNAPNQEHEKGGGWLFE